MKGEQKPTDREAYHAKKEASWTSTQMWYTLLGTMWLYNF